MVDVICPQCALSADWDVRRLAWNRAHPGNPVRERRPKDPQHCTDPTCTCRHRPVKPKESDGGAQAVRG